MHAVDGKNFLHQLIGSLSHIFTRDLYIPGPRWLFRSFSINRINGDETETSHAKRRTCKNRAMLFGKKSVNGYLSRKLAYPHIPPKGSQGGDIVFFHTCTNRVGLSNIGSNTVCHVLCIAEDSRTHFIVDL